MRVTLRQIEAFRAVCDTGAITAAARRLAISQPAMSRLISDFAALVGFDLFQRRNGRLVPTQEALFLLPEANRVLEDVGRIVQLTRDLRTRRAGHLRIACLPGFATSHLPGVLAGFLKARPGVTVTLEPDRPERILEWIVGEQYDCGITDDFSGHASVRSRTIAVRTVCAVPEGHRLAKAARVQPRDIAGEPIIHTRRDSGFYQNLRDAFASDGAALAGLVETRQFTAACQLVAHGLGVAIVSEFDADMYVGRGLVKVPFEPALHHRLSLVQPVNRRASELTEEFLQTFADSLEPFAVPDPAAGQ